MCPSLIDMDTSWSIDDVMRANAIMDMRNYYSDKKAKEAKNKK